MHDKLYRSWPKKCIELQRRPEKKSVCKQDWHACMHAILVKIEIERRKSSPDSNMRVMMPSSRRKTKRARKGKERKGHTLTSQNPSPSSYALKGLSWPPFSSIFPAHTLHVIGFNFSDPSTRPRVVMNTAASVSQMMSRGIVCALP